tara:strand:+ start:1191 stop:1511 length:321 start_codon:yes stop_codon:yes gene_type:complete
MKLTKLITIFLVFIFFTGCSSVKKTLTGQNKKKNSDEFLVDKKNPLIIPPEFSKLPVPQDSSENQSSKQDANIDLSKILTKSSKKSKNGKSNNSLERSISNILKNN